MARRKDFCFEEASAPPRFIIVKRFKILIGSLINITK